MTTQTPTTRVLDYVAQPNGYTCQSACVARIIGTEDVMGVRVALEAIGNPGSPSTMGQYLQSKIREYHFNDNASILDMREALSQGYQLITHGWFTSESGHVIGLEGVEPDPTKLSYKFITDDPWYEFDFPSGTFTQNSGENVRYSSYGIYAYCVASDSYEAARKIYARGELDSARKGAWLHLCKN
ncbi:hypothetical protein ACKFKF_04460 [Phormidesmis sp. 146-12]